MEGAGHEIRRIPNSPIRQKRNRLKPRGGQVRAAAADGHPSPRVAKRDSGTTRNPPSNHLGLAQVMTHFSQRPIVTFHPSNAV